MPDASVNENGKTPSITPQTDLPAAAPRDAAFAPSMRVPAHGRDRLRSGGTNRGGSGRPRTDFVRQCRFLLDAPDHLQAIERVLADPDHRHWLGLRAQLLCSGHGKPPDEAHVDLTVRPRPNMKEVRARIERRLIEIEQRQEFAERLKAEHPELGL